MLGARTQETCSTCHLKKPKVTVGRGCGEEPPAPRAPAGPSDDGGVPSLLMAEGPSSMTVGDPSMMAEDPPLMAGGRRAKPSAAASHRAAAGERVENETGHC